MAEAEASADGAEEVLEAEEASVVLVVVASAAAEREDLGNSQTCNSGTVF